MFRYLITYSSSLSNFELKYLPHKEAYYIMHIFAYIIYLSSAGLGENI